jgi:hypothetical protein
MPTNPSELPVDFAEIVANLVTEDDEPVDNLFSAKQQRLLVEPLYSSWSPQPEEDGKSEAARHFLADANVGVFFLARYPPLVPDMFLSLDVQVKPEYIASEQRSYFVWEFGKSPDVVVEVVSNKKGGELDEKIKAYGQMGVTYYVVFDPWQELSQVELRVFELIFGKRYRLRNDFNLPEVGLSLTLWPNPYEEMKGPWLRWRDHEGILIPTGAERADQEAERADRAESELKKLREELDRLKNPST